MRWDLSFGGGANRRDQGVPSSDINERSLNGHFITNAFWLWDSDSSYTRVNARGQVLGFRSTASTANTLVVPAVQLVSDTDSDNQSLQEYVSVDVTHRLYLSPVPIAIMATGVISGNYGQSWSSVDRHEDLANAGNTIVTDEQTRSEFWLYSPTAAVSLGGGVGRVRDATGVYEARILEERLREEGVLTRELSRDARQRLAALAYLRWSASGVHDRPARSVWAEIEQILIEDDAIADTGLTAEAIMRALERYQEGSSIHDTGIPASPIVRSRGSFAGVFAEYRHVREQARRDDELSRTRVVNGVPDPPVHVASGTRSEITDDRLLVGVQGESYWPLTLELQLGLNGQVLAPVREEDTELFTRAGAHLGWIVSDRWLATASGVVDWFDADRFTGDSAGDESRWFVSARVDYYVENRMALFATLFDTERTVRGGTPGLGAPPTTYQRDRGVSVGITYRLAGRYAAPGFDHLGL